jgi:hypothetical protein
MSLFKGHLKYFLHQEVFLNCTLWINDRDVLSPLIPGKLVMKPLRLFWLFALGWRCLGPH